MRYYLDTNILVALFTRTTDNLNHDVRTLIGDCSEIFYASSVAVHELIHLIQIERIRCSKSEKIKASDVIHWLDICGIKTVYVSKRHLQTYSEMPIVQGHTDPSDRLIIAQAITDRIPIISTDLRFPTYAPVGLEHIPGR
ncbi:MAG: PIN domain-containing protein [Bacteroidaceae bacterium]|nr:PIN domain-containing protein [Bacteroidaceae bacterium]